MLTTGKSVQKIVDSALDPRDDLRETKAMPQYFDIIAIDSRGLNNSTPCFSCFPTLASRQVWTWDSAAEGILGSSNLSFQTKWARMQAIGNGCPRKAMDSESSGDQLALYANTTPQIADMVAILELHGKWREREAQQEMTNAKGHLSDEQRLRILERTRWRKNEEKLNFWGFSYGTVIGATFAAMQPHRVRRVVLDGVVDTEDYYTGQRLTALFDTDHELERLAQHCYTAGPKHCALYADAGMQEILRKVQNLIASLKRNPVGIPGTAGLGPHLITYSDVVRAVFNSLYAPIQEFPTLAKGLNNLLNGNGTAFAVLEQQQQHQQLTNHLLEQCDHENMPYASQQCHIQRHSPGDTRTAIICTDSNTTFAMTPSDFEKYIETLQQQSGMFAEMFAEVRMKCIAWNLRPKWRFPGPFSGNPASPMLMVGTLADPVTPIRK